MTIRRDRSVLVAGCGSIGRRHLRNLRSLGLSRLSASDPDPARLAAAAAETGASPHPDFAAALSSERFEAVLVCTPPSLHVGQARQAVDAGAHVFVEKPVSHSLEGLDELAADVRAARRVCQVGYNLRFDAGLKMVRELLVGGAIGRVLWARAEYGQYLPDWRPGRDYRETYSARKGLGGGVLLDVSHELDYVVWLLGTPSRVTAMSGRVSGLDVDVDDCATVLLRFAGGAQADVHVDFVQRGYSRSCKLAGELGTLLWDFAAREVLLYLADTNAWETRAYGGDPNDMYVAELEHFFRCIDGEAKPQTSLEEARAVLELVLSAGREEAVAP